MKNILFIIILFTIPCLGQKASNSVGTFDIKLKNESPIQIHIDDSTLFTNDINLDTVIVKVVDSNLNKKIKEEESWFSKYLPSLIALFVLFVTNLVVLIKIRLDSKESIKREITLTSIKLDKERLELFYNPIFTTLSTNEDIFNSFGPRTFPEDDNLRNEASIIWQKMVKEIILPNNKLIIDTITAKSHLIDKEDDLGRYLQFLKHAQSYSQFIENPNSLHKNFKYDPIFRDKVKKYRDSIISKLNTLENKLKI